MTKPISRKMAVACLLHRMMVAARIAADGLIELPCGICGKPLLATEDIQFDHIHADVFGGEHHFTNLRPVHYDPCHKSKTRKDVQANAKVKRLRGENKPRVKKRIPSRPTASCGKKWPSRKFQKKK